MGRDGDRVARGGRALAERPREFRGKTSGRRAVRKMRRRGAMLLAISPRWLRASLLLASAAGVGCSGAVEEEPPEGSVDPDAAGGDAMTEASAPIDAGSAVCDALLAQSAAALAPAYQEAAGDLSCTTDDDCVLVSDSTQCSYGCGVITNHTGVAILTGAFEAQNTSTCGQFNGDGCVAQWAPCSQPIASGAQCITSQCVPGLPAGWISFAVESDTGGAGVDLGSGAVRRNELHRVDRAARWHLVHPGAHRAAHHASFGRRSGDRRRHPPRSFVSPARALRWVCATCRPAPST